MTTECPLRANTRRVCRELLVPSVSDVFWGSLGEIMAQFSRVCQHPREGLPGWECLPGGEEDPQRPQLGPLSFTQLLSKPDPLAARTQFLPLGIFQKLFDKDTRTRS